jgi:hypothetical protein
MRFVIHNNALNGDDSSLALIDRLVDRMAEEVHRVDLPEADLLEASRWYQSARQTRQKVLMSAVAGPPKQPTSEGPHIRVVEVDDPESVRLAERLAHTPLIVLVEDREADGVLLEIVVEELGWPSLQELWKRAQQVTPRAIEIDTAGGIGNFRHRLERAASEAISENRPIRHFVIFDSDLRWPGDYAQQTAQDSVRQACDAHDAPYHQWLKRCAENYIPDQVFETASEDARNLKHADRFEALLRRSSAQRDYFPVKEGLTATERSKAIEAGLYDASEEGDLALLETRVFPKRPRPLLLLSMERRAAFTAEGLRARDGEGELDTLLHAIAKEL